MRLAYLVTTYPAVSHTFIRREIREMERRGHSVLRLAIRRSKAPLADAQDREEEAKTLQCLSQPIGRLFAAQIRMVVTRPRAWLGALGLALAMGWKSDRGLLRHLAYLAEAAFLAQVLAEQSIEHVHAHFATNAATVARLIRRLGGPRYSFTVHGIDLFDAPRLQDIRGKAADAAFVVAVCDFSAAQVQRWSEVADWSKVHVVRCAVGADFLEAGDGMTPAGNIFVCVGRLSPEKGQILLIDALGELVRSGEDARLVLVGDGEMRPVIERRVRELGLDGRVEITGYVDGAEVRSRILAGRALVLPSFAEGLPAVLMEALALGRPAISTYVAGIPELVCPGENGWLVPAGNAVELASAMREALHAPDETLRSMGRKGNELVRRRHRLETEVAKLEALLRDSAGAKA